MTKTVATLIAGFALFALASCQGKPAPLPTSTIEVQYLRSTPVENSRFAQGVSACFAGVSQGHLLMAGGCNFPDTPAAEGGAKVYYSEIYAAPISPDTTLSWKKVGELPQETAYGISIPTANGVICIGGMNNEKRLTEVYQIELDSTAIQAIVTPLPSLPEPIDNAAGAIVNNTIYVVGGNQAGIPCNSHYSLSLDNLEKGWERLTDFPGPARTQAVAVALTDENGEKVLALWGGFAGAHGDQPATLSVDGWQYTPSTQAWTSLPAPICASGDTLSLGGGTAITLTDSTALCMGGVNKDIFLNALRNPAPDYLTHPAEWYRFNNRLMVYNNHQHSWTEIATLPESARAGATTLFDSIGYLIIHGELKPGVRTPAITRILPLQNQSHETERI